MANCTFVFSSYQGAACIAIWFLTHDWVKFFIRRCWIWGCFEHQISILFIISVRFCHFFISFKFPSFGYSGLMNLQNMHVSIIGDFRFVEIVLSSIKYVDIYFYKSLFWYNHFALEPFWTGFRTPCFLQFFVGGD